MLRASVDSDGQEEDISDDLKSPAFGAVIGSRINYSKEFFSDVQFTYGFSDIFSYQNITNYSFRLGGGLYI